jgi:hypothetical protein
MKRFISALTCLGLAVVGMVYMSACAAQKGPLSPSTSLVSPTSASTGLPQVSSVSFTSGATISVSQTARVVFNLAMNPASFNTGTVQIYTQSTDGFSEAAYTGYTVSYDATIRTLFIAPSPAYWSDNTVYRIVLTTGITSITGAQLDGNLNSKAEAAAFDNFITSFKTGVPTAPAYGNINSLVSGGGPLAPISATTLVINYYTVAADGQTSQATATLTGNLSGIAASLPVTITASFDHRLDVATAWASATALAPAFTFATSAGTAVAPTSVTLTSGNMAIQMEFMSGLAASTKFQIGIKGGLTGLRSANESNLNLLRYCYFDGDGDGKAEATDDTEPLYLTTNGGSFSTVITTPPYINLAGDIAYTSGVTNPSGNGPTSGYWTIAFTTPSGNGKMDASTLNAANIQILGSTSSGNFGLSQVFSVVTPKDIVYDVATNKVYVYMPDKFWSTQGNGTNGYLYFKVLINHNVRSSDGLYFDGNGDGVSSQDFNDDKFYGNGSTNSVYIYTNP